MRLGDKAGTTAIAILLLLGTGTSAAAQTVISVVDKNDRPVQGAVVYLEDADLAPAASKQTAVIDQIGKRFVPHVTAVRAGTEISFPNSDSVSHHVYSFSSANRFELPLYKGETRPSIRFDQPGLVTLGCNIHDSMLAYIMVVESAVYGVTDHAGQLQLDLTATKGTWRVWSPLLRTAEVVTPELLQAGNPGNITLKLAAAQRDTKHSNSGSLSWDEY
jgi:plastocyanin